MVPSDYSLGVRLNNVRGWPSPFFLSPESPSFPLRRPRLSWIGSISPDAEGAEPLGIGDFGEAGMPARGGCPAPSSSRAASDECLIHAFSTLVGGPAVRHVLLGAWLAMAAVMTTGCGGGSTDGLPRQAVSGEVKLDGQPLADGMITFIPAGIEGPPVGPHRSRPGRFPSRPGTGRSRGATASRSIAESRPGGRRQGSVGPDHAHRGTVRDDPGPLQRQVGAEGRRGGGGATTASCSTSPVRSRPPLEGLQPSVNRRPARHASPTLRGGGVRSGPRG